MTRELKAIRTGRYECVCARSYPTLCDPMDVARQVPLSMGFLRQEYWSGLPFPMPGGFPDPEIKPALAGEFLTTEPPEKPPLNSELYENPL